MRLLSILAALGFLAAAPAQAQCVTSNPLRPVMKSHTPPPLPPGAVDRLQKSVVLLQVSIDPQGAAAVVEVIEGSGSQAVDEIVRAHVLANWRWLPPTTRCVPYAVRTRVHVSLR